MNMRFGLCLLGMLAMATATIHFQEEFGDDWESRWVTSDWKKDKGEAGDWKHTAGDFYGDAEASKGIQTSQDARFYAISAATEKAIDNTETDLVLQFQVRHPQKIDCGGGYIKLFPSALNQKELEGDSDYSIMFGPDICGVGTKRVHVIFNYKGKNHLINKDITCETDQLSHVYTLIVKTDGTYVVNIDGEEKATGALIEDWDFLPAKEINDPEQSKPEDWVDEAMIDDPEDEKPAGYDEIEADIPDPEAEKPDDWDEEDDGEWDAPMIPNPEFKGEWSAKRIANPDYKGKWVHPQVPNPEFDEAAASEVGKFSDNAFVGFDLWQVKAGSIFDNIIVTDNIEEAEAFMAATWGVEKDAEKEAFDKAEETRRAEEEAERKRLQDEAAEDDDDEEDDEAEDDEDDEDYDDEEEAGHDEL